MTHCCLYAGWLVMGRCPAVWANVCHFPHKWKHLDTEVCPEVRAVEALTHKVAGRQPVEEMSKADWWREREERDTYWGTSHTPATAGVLPCTECITVHFLGVFYCFLCCDTVVTKARTQVDVAPPPPCLWCSGSMSPLWIIRLLRPADCKIHNLLGTCWNITELIIHSFYLGGWVGGSI